MESNPYRLAAGLTGRWDSGRVLRLWRDGRVPEALEASTAPLLSRSGILAVQSLRDQLDLAVGSAVRATRAVSLLLRWLTRLLGPRMPRPSRRWACLLVPATRGTWLNGPGWWRRGATE
ncbi:hypothetical protein OVA06_12920 [Pseudarthrobacter sp. SL88]|uniref:hypothetical protein n=1 Tax=Pseudarthrobacter sp. SL88 TaxID=2994666 RepID=UPI002275AA51|nr:hypothetical protein [Pseudarthrobacter sp. SL88]MCY1675597.1 hypothetical protein [Pseudarthrobacter sp. SL88]